MSNNNDFNLEEALNYLAERTRTGAIQWIVTDFSPLAESIGVKGDTTQNCVMSRTNVSSDYNGKAIYADISERIFLDSGKGDVMVIIDHDGGAYSCSFTYSPQFLALPAHRLANICRQMPMARFSDAVLSAVINERMVNEQKRSAPMYLSGRFFTSQQQTMPLTKLCIKLAYEGRLMDFHRAVLDFDFRNVLLREIA